MLTEQKRATKYQQFVSELSASLNPNYVPLWIQNLNVDLAQPKADLAQWKAGKEPELSLLEIYSDHKQASCLTEDEAFSMPAFMFSCISWHSPTFPKSLNEPPFSVALHTSALGSIADTGNKHYYRSISTDGILLNIFDHYYDWWRSPVIILPDMRNDIYLLLFVSHHHLPHTLSQYF